MRIGIEACTWANRRGYGRFTRGLVSSMVRDFPEHEFVLVADRFTASAGVFPPGARLEVVETSAQPTEAASADGSRSPVDLLRMSAVASRLTLDVFLFPTSYTYFPLLSRTPAVVIFHDATAELHPGLIFRRWQNKFLWDMKSRLARANARRVVTVSADARRQMMEAFKYAEADIDVVSEGADEIFQPAARNEDVLRAYQLPTDKPIVLYVGGISPHKNLDGLLKAFASMERGGPPAHLAIVGDYKGDAFLTVHSELVALVESLGLGSSVTFTGFVPDERLVELYNATTMLILPSFNEGFGLPVVEAMSCGLPVAVSDRSSLPEVVADAGVLFDPTSTAQISAAMRRILTDEAFRRALRAAGLERARAYSWQSSARTMMRILEHTARGPRSKD